MLALGGRLPPLRFFAELDVVTPLLNADDVMLSRLYVGLPDQPLWTVVRVNGSTDLHRRQLNPSTDAGRDIIADSSLVWPLHID